MGWQLFPVGIGWREFTSTPGRGEFSCPNPRCKSAGTSTQYLHKAGRNWFTVLFIPVIPMNKTGEWIRCARCKSLYPLHVVDRHGGADRVAVPRTAPPSAPPTASRPPLTLTIGTAPPPPAVPPPSPVPTPAPSPEPRISTGPTIRFADGGDVELVDPVVIGRDPAPVAQHPTASMYRVPDPTVSKTHLVVGRTGDEVWVLDLHSSNGVFVGASPTSSDRIPAGRRVMLASGSVVSVGDSTSFTVVRQQR